MKWFATALLLLPVTAAPQESQRAGAEFYQPIRSDDLTAVRKLIRNTGVNARDRRGSTPLMYAAALGSFDAVKLLVEAGARVNAANDFGATALMWCAGDSAKVRYLISKGANVQARSKLGRTPLSIAAMYDGASENVRLMIEKGADVKARDESGATPLANAATVNNVEAARILLAKGAEVNATDEAGFTPLINAAGNGDRSAGMVKLLLDHGAKVNVTTIASLEMVKNGPIRLGLLTPLILAAPQGNYETVALLVNAGADVNVKDARGMSPLALAVATDHADPRIVRLLLSKGAGATLKPADGGTAVDWARKYRNPKVLRALGLPIEELPAAPPGPAPSRSAAAAVESSVALMQRASAKYLEAGGCLACHAQHLTGIAVAAARASGIKVDAPLEAAQARVVDQLRGGLEQTLFQVVDPIAGVDALQFSLMQVRGAGIPASLSLDSLVFHIAAMQRKEGDWPNYGVARPPLEDGGFSHTAKGIRALQLYLIPGRRAEFQERIARAAAWLEKATPRTMEDRTMQLLGICWANRKPPADRVKELIVLQRPDGSWGQTNDLPGDAYATGEALYALHETGMPATNQVYRRGVDYLLRTQSADGSWHVTTRAAAFQPYFESGFPHGHDQWISQAGTAFAAVALAGSIAH